MQKERNNNIFSQMAMQNGTLLGLLWCIMYASFILGLTNIFFAFMFLAINFASPFYAGYLAKKFRKEHCNDCWNFSQAFTFLLIMYICASLLSAVVQFLYFKFIDNGYFMQTMQQLVSILNENPQASSSMTSELNTALDTLAGLSTKGLIINFLSSNITNAIFLAPIIALFVRKRTI